MISLTIGASYLTIDNTGTDANAKIEKIFYDKIIKVTYDPLYVYINCDGTPDNQSSKTVSFKYETGITNPATANIAALVTNIVNARIAYLSGVNYLKANTFLVNTTSNYNTLSADAFLVTEDAVFSVLKDGATSLLPLLFSEPSSTIKAGTFCKCAGHKITEITLTSGAVQMLTL